MGPHLTIFFAISLFYLFTLTEQVLKHNHSPLNHFLHPHHQFIAVLYFSVIWVVIDIEIQIAMIEII